MFMSIMFTNTGAQYKSLFPAHFKICYHS